MMCCQPFRAPPASSVPRDVSQCLGEKPLPKWLFEGKAANENPDAPEVGNNINQDVPTN